jgi:hypothetical protein
MTTVSVAFQLGMGALLVLVGRWGGSHAVQLSSTMPTEDERERRRRVITRGSAACQVMGGVFALMVIPLFV